jgi:DNA polymerase-3 subunit gamma/tau
VQFNDILAKGFDGHQYIAGLASHFRDLLVCKNEATLTLLEIGEDTKQKYITQAQKASEQFLLNCIELANACDLKYKNSSNPRLLVELTLMQMASITFDGEKKKDEHFIIPPSYFKSKGIEPVRVKVLGKTNQTVTTTAKIEPEKKEIQPAQNPITQIPDIPKISIDKSKKQTSGLSLKSIREKKEHQIKQLDVVIDEEQLPREAVSEEALLEAWEAYTQSLHKKGEKILASILEMEKPKLQDTAICLTYSNNTNKLELERSQYPLMMYLKKRLRNYDLHLKIKVNEEVAKKYAFTPQEKYEKLKKKNNNIELLKKTFGLDV